MDIDSDLVENIKACRTCGIHYVTPAKHQLKHLFQSCQEHSEIMLIRLELAQWNVEVSENDGYPQYVCNTCIHKFEQVFQLRAACINAQNEFRKFYAMPNGNVANVKIKTEFPDLDTEPSICDFIYVDELSDTEFDSAAPFNFPHIPIKEEVIEAATIPMEETEQLTDIVESASEVLVQTNPPSAHIPELELQNTIVTASQPSTVVQIATNEFKCKLCQYHSSSQLEHKIHMETNHDIRDIVCNICGKEFKNCTTARLKFHMKWHTLNKQVKCTLCGFLCNSKDVLREHKRSNHRKLKCKICGKGVLAKKMKSHLRQHEISSKYNCEYCTEAFDAEDERENHIWQIHANEGNNDFTNSVGSLQTPYSQTMNENSFNVPQEEMLSQEPEETVLLKYMCAHCEHRFINQIDLETHVSEKHRSRLSTVEPKAVEPFVEDTQINEFSEITVNDENVNKHTEIALIDEYDKNNEVNSSKLLPQNFIPHSSLSEFANQTENLQIKTVSASNSSDEENDCANLAIETKDLSLYVDNNLNTFACAKCTETFVTIQELREHHVQHIASDQQYMQVTKNEDKSRFRCNLCGKYFDLKFSLNRHVKRHKHAPI